MTVITMGDKAPDFYLQTVGGKTLSLYESLQAKDFGLLIFLRHLG